MAKTPSFRDLAKKAAEDRRKAEQTARKGYNPEEIGSNADRPQSIQGEATLGSRVADASGAPAWQADPAKEAAKREYADRQKALLAAIGIRDPKDGTWEDRKWALDMVHAWLAVYASQEEEEESSPVVEGLGEELEDEFFGDLADEGEALVDGLAALEGFTRTGFVTSVVWPLASQLLYSALYGRKYQQQLAVESAKVRAAKRPDAQVSPWLVEKVSSITVGLPEATESLARLLLAVEQHDETVEVNTPHGDAPLGVIGFEDVASALADSVARKTTSDKGKSVGGAERARLFDLAFEVVQPGGWKKKVEAVNAAEAERAAKAEAEAARAVATKAERIAAYVAEMDLLSKK